ncbi:MAG: hypothetical protein LBF22_06215, partial [Deltaproteobacteria bacterium]|nr:hypothetical protein [Deltaproteobacteria bacterium]
LDYVIFVGDFGKNVQEGAFLQGFPADRFYLTHDPLSAAQWAAEKAQPGDWVLIKGSQGVNLGQSVTYFLGGKVDL